MRLTFCVGAARADGVPRSQCGKLNGAQLDILRNHAQTATDIRNLCNHAPQIRCNSIRIPEGVLVIHIAGSFIEMVLWWSKGNSKHTPEERNQYFRAVIELNIRA
ncbi:hypothetical protein [Agathobaculum sp. Marseille-P7918]|uniref:hypothetical protein n=1 Tax=Agathobaculum sp. Marseille-P7918 TaxID=2479843 RepID=UPI00356AEF53